MDLETAKGTIGIEKYYATAFFSQQAAEKALKAMALKKLRQPMKTHNLLELAKKVKVPHEIMRCLIELTPDFVITRYPDAANGLPYELYDLKKAKQRVVYAEKVLKWVKAWMKK